VSAAATAAAWLSFLGLRHEDIPGGGERIYIAKIPVWDSRRRARRLALRAERIKLRAERRAARRASP
jgi:hypothetical protein